MESHSFQLQALESRALLSGSLPSGIGAAPLHEGMHALGAAASPATASSFVLSGSYTLEHVPADTGAVYDFTGSGVAGSLGQVNVTGSIGTPGLVANGRARGSLVFSNGSGTVTLDVRGPREPGFGPMPKALLYTVTAADGSFAGTTGSGSVEVVLYRHGHRSHFTFTFHPAS